MTSLKCFDQRPDARNGHFF